MSTGESATIDTHHRMQLPMSSHRFDVLISEVGPRDGLQSVASTMSTAHKLAWIAALAHAGLQEIEVGSFVSPKLLPQMADAAEVVAQAITLPGVTVMALAPNLRGAEAALRAGAHKVTLPVSASPAHSMANVRKTPMQMVDEVRAIAALRDEIAPQALIEAGISTAFGCTLQGLVPEDEVIALALACVAAGADESGLSDTTGMANPAQVRRLFTRLRAELGEHAGAAHMHNTRGLGLANCLAAYEAGVRTFDASLAGLGGCPYAPGASGNVVTEDLVFMFEAMGIRTGMDIDRLIAARAAAGRRPARRAELYGMTPRGRPAQGLCAPHLRTGLSRSDNPHVHSPFFHEPTHYSRHGRRPDRATALRRHPRGRVHPHGHGPVLRHGAGRPGRRSHQGRARGPRPRRRCHAPAAGLGRGLFPAVQPQQEKPDAGPAEHRGRQAGRAAPDRHGRHRLRELQARHHAPSWGWTTPASRTASTRASST